MSDPSRSALYSPPLMGQMAVQASTATTIARACSSARPSRRIARCGGRTSQFIQVLASKGAVQGSPIAVLSANRPQILYNIAAMMMSG